MDIYIPICLQTLTIAMTTQSKTKLAYIFLENQYQFEREANYQNDICILGSFLSSKTIK